MAEGLTTRGGGGVDRPPRRVTPPAAGADMRDRAAIRAGSSPPPCPLCGATDIGLLYPSTLAKKRESGSQYHCTSHGLGIHPDIWRCRTCSMVFNEAAPESSDVAGEYAEVEDPEYLAQRESRRLTFDRELDAIEAVQSKGELLDVGCYTGFFLECARDRGWRVRGVEPSRWAARHAVEELGLDVFNGTIEQFETDHTFDVITMWDVLEHVPNPVEVLARLRRLQRPDGLLVFATHNLDTAVARVLGRHFPLFMEMHTVHFNNRTLHMLLDKAGYRLDRKHNQRRAVRLGYLLSRLRRFGDRPERLANALVRRLSLEDRILWTGLVGVETYFARPI